MICYYPIVITSLLVNQNVELVIGGKANIQIFVELCLYIVSSELFSVLLAAHIISREVYFLSRSNDRSFGCVESPRMFTNTRRALLSYLSPHVRAPVVTGQRYFGAREFSAMPKAYLYALSLTLLRNESLFSDAVHRGR